MKIFGYDVSKTKEVETTKKSFATSNIISNMTGRVTLDSSVFFELYKKNPDIRQAINKISLAVASNGLNVLDGRGEKVKDLNIDAKMEWLFEMPTFQKFKKELFKQYLISWELYIVDTRTLNEDLAWFQIMDSRSMQKRYNAEWDIIWFTQWNNRGQSRNYTREEVAFYKFENDTTNENDGMGQLTWIVRDALGDIEWAKKNYYVIDNDSMPGWMIMLNDWLSVEEQQNAIDQFRRQHKGSENSNKLMVSGGVKDIKSLYITNKDMDWINQRKLTTNKVSAAMWVPKNILWYVDDVNLANGKELRKEYIEWTIRPLEKDFEFILNSLLAKFDPLNAQRYTLQADGETLEEQAEIEVRQREDVRLWLLTIDETRIQRGQEPFNTDQSKNPIITSNMIMLEDMIQSQPINLNEF